MDSGLPHYIQVHVYMYVPTLYPLQNIQTMRLTKQHNMYNATHPRQSFSKKNDLSQVGNILHSRHMLYYIHVHVGVVVPIPDYP